MVALHYFQATDIENIGNSEHEDGNLITILLQDQVGGLEVRKDGEWIPVTPTEGTLIVNIGDIVQVNFHTYSYQMLMFFPFPSIISKTCYLQVLSNDKYKSATHRVVRTKGRDRYSYAFFYNLQAEKWVEPLPEFSTSIGESPKYKKFLYKDYQALRMRNKTHPPSRSEDVINITHYSVPN